MSSYLSIDTIKIRPYQSDDVAAFYTTVHSSIATVGQWLPWCHEQFSLSDAKAWITTCQQSWRSEREFPFVITVDTQANLPQIIGGVGISQLNPRHRCANLGYWVCSTAVGQGVATAAVKQAAGFAFNQLKLVRLEIVTMLDNWASRKVAEKVGATLEGVVRNRLVAWGKAHDAALYSLIPEDKMHHQATEPIPLISNTLHINL